MLKQHSQIIAFLMGLCDLVVVACAWMAAFGMRFTLFPYEKGIPALHAVLTNLAVVLGMAVAVLAGTGLYKPRRDKSFLLEMGQILRASVFIWVLLIVMIYFTSPGPFTRGMLALFLPLLMAGLILERGLYRSVLRYVRRRGWNLRHAVIVGTGRLGQLIYLRLQRNSWAGIRVAGFIEVPAHPGEERPGRTVRGLPVLGTTEHVQEVVELTGVDCVFVALPSQQGDVLRRVVGDLERTMVDVRIVPDLFLSRFPTHAGISEFDGMPLLSLRENPLAGWPSIYKRVFDILGAGFGLLLASPLFAAIAVLIKLQDGGPVFYRQRRMSFGHRAFMMLKFRTMVLHAEEAGPAFATRNDPRCTWIGRWLRSWSLDELPQLWNVMRGEMSLVGPRPERPEMLEKIQQEVPEFPTRLMVRAGLTGWAQVNGYRGRTSFRKRLQYDMYYLNNWSPLLDVRIVLTTIVRGLRHPNAY